ncbi:MAG: ABC transporter ATP-binding protein [Candidatus Caldarchaeum sp.]
MLEGRGVTKRFGGLLALSDIEFELQEEEVVALIGPNGSGKTTLFNIISGLMRPDKGRIMFDGIDITHKPPQYICKIGISRTFQIVRPFRNLTVRENVALAAIHGGQGANLKEAMKRSEEILEVVGIGDKADQPAGAMTLVDIKRMEIARALATNPRVLLLDEPMAGLIPSEIMYANQLINRLRKEMGISIFLVEHVMRVVAAVSDRVIVLNYGEKLAEGSPSEVMRDHRVVQAYLGDRGVD